MNHNPKGSRCVICDDSVTGAMLGERSPLCNDFQCRQLHAQRLTMPPRLYAPHLAFQTSLIRGRRATEAARKKRVERVTTKETAENLAALQLFKARSGRDDLIDIVMIPSVPENSVAVSDDRRAAYINHLKAEMADAIKCDDVTALAHDQHYTLIERRVAQDAFLAEHPDIAARSDRLCGLCRGGCCMQGGDHGYVSAVMLRRQLDADPEMSPEALMDIYVDCIPDATIDGGCINQGISGCGLPRSRRSDICNHYTCEPLREHQANLLRPGSSTSVFVVQRGNHHWNRFASGEVNPMIACYVLEGDERTDVVCSEPNERTAVDIYTCQ